MPQTRSQRRYLNPVATLKRIHEARIKQIEETRTAQIHDARTTQIIEAKVNRFAAQIGWDSTEITQIREQMTQPKQGNLELQGRIIAVLAVHTRNGDSSIDTYLLESNPTYPVFTKPGTPSAVLTSKVLHYQLAFDCFNRAHNNIPGHSANPDMVIFTNADDAKIDSMTWDQLKKLVPYRASFNVALNYTGYFYSLETKGDLQSNPRNEKKTKYPKVRLGFQRAVLLNFFGESNDWQTEENQCTQDFVKTIGRVRHAKYLEYLADNVSDVQPGVDLEVFCNFLHTQNIYFYILNPMFQIIDKHRNGMGRKHDTICLMVNNDHIYPIINKKFIEMCHNSSIGDTILRFDDIEIKDYTDPDVCTIHQADDLNQLVLDLFAKRKQVATVVKFVNNKIACMKFDDQMYLCNSNLEEVTAACKEFEIPFENQSIDKVCYEIVNKLAKLPHACRFTEDALMRFNQHSIAPYTQYFTEQVEIANIQSIDICRFYTSLLYNKTDPYVFIDLDCDFKRWTDYPLESIKMGFYRLKCDIEMCHKYVKIPAGTLVSNGLLSYLISSDYCILDDISEYILSHRYIPGDYFKSTIKYLYENHGDSKILKRIINSFIGWMGIYKSTTSNGFITSEKSTAEAFAATMVNPVVKTLGKLFTVSQVEEKLLNINYRPIWAQVICDSYIQLDTLIKSVVATEGVILHAVKTDCLVIEGDANLPVKPKHPTIHQIGMAFNEESVSYHFKDYVRVGSDYVSPRRELTYYDSNELDGLLESKSSFAIWGVAGTGKTYLVKNRVIKYFEEQGIRYRVLTLAHLALQKYDSNKEVLASFFLPGKAQVKYDYIIVDEFSMVSMYFYEQLYKLKKGTLSNPKEGNTKFILIGDTNQCLPVETRVFCRYEEAGFIRELIDYNVVRLTEVQRYDVQLHDACSNLIKNGIFKFQPADVNACSNLLKNAQKKNVQHICYTNVQCKKINDLELKNRAKEQFEPRICISNTGKYKNGDRLFYDRTNHKYSNSRKVMELDPQPTNADKFIPAYCLTAHKAQGQTIDGIVVVHEATKMDKNLLYTAVTRCTSYDNLYCADKNKVIKPKKEEGVDPPYDCSKFKVGGIYKLYNDDEKIFYVGCVEDYDRTSLRIEQHLLKKSINDAYEAHSDEKVRYSHLSELYEAETKAIQAALKEDQPLVNKQKIGLFTPIDDSCFKFYSLASADPPIKYKVYECNGAAIIKLKGKLVKKFKVTNTRTIEEAMELAEEYVKSL